MERVGVLIVSYGARESAIVDTLCLSTNYDVTPYVIDKQANPFNLKWVKEREGVHVVDPKLSIATILEVLTKHQNKLDYVLCPNEGPIISGLRDEAEKLGINVPLLFPTLKYALERSKVEQRLLLQQICPKANPKFQVFSPEKYGNNLDKLRTDVIDWVNKLGGVNKTVVKPDEPGFGKGVGVGGEHFFNMDKLFVHVLSLYEMPMIPGSTIRKPFIVEERLEGEESSFQAYCDGSRFVVLPETRDYKRAFDGDKGLNTGGMGSYMDNKLLLPFMTLHDRGEEIEIINTLHKFLSGNGRNLNLVGMPYYVAFMHTRDGPKVLEINSREGDPEIINILPVMKNDLVDVHFSMIDGNLERIEVEEKATVVTYKVPPNYGGCEEVCPELVIPEEVGKPVNLNDAVKLSEESTGAIRIYPASMELRNGETFALKSRAVASVGIGDDIQSARELSLSGLRAIKGGSLWYRTDIGSEQHIQRSIEHMRRLRHGDS
jgi:phosphoribosylamine--glycine ligase